jgi:hypothetical protein
MIERIHEQNLAVQQFFNTIEAVNFVALIRSRFKSIETNRLPSHFNFNEISNEVKRVTFFNRNTDEK